MQTKLRKASSDGKVKDTRKTSPTRRDASTSTEGLGMKLTHPNLGHESHMLISVIRLITESCTYKDRIF